MKIFINLIFITFVLISGFARANSTQRHVLYIGLDGCREDAFDLVATDSDTLTQYPRFAQLMQTSLIARHLQAGTDSEGQFQQATLSGPGWTTLLTGLWANQHHIYSNTDLEKENYNHAYPTLFNTVKNFLPESTVASFTDWEPLGLLASYTFYGNDAADINKTFSFHGVTDLPIQEDAMTEAAINSVRKTIPPTLVFIRYANPDEIGHLYGFDPKIPEYVNAIKSEIAHIEYLLKAVKESEEQKNDWLIILTTDHGGHEHIHGTTKWEDKIIFAIVHASDDVRYNHLTLSDIPQDQTTFLPTIYDYLNIPKKVYSYLPGKIIH